jgi:hypothetical protein
MESLFYVSGDPSDAWKLVRVADFARQMFGLEPAPSNTASADVDWKAAWEAAAKVVVAVGRFLEAEKEGNSALIEDAHFGLLRTMADYKAGKS